MSRRPVSRVYRITWKLENRERSRKQVRMCGIIMEHKVRWSTVLCTWQPVGFSQQISVSLPLAVPQGDISCCNEYVMKCGLTGGSADCRWAGRLWRRRQRTLMARWRWRRSVARHGGHCCRAGVDRAAHDGRLDRSSWRSLPTASHARPDEQPNDDQHGNRWRRDYYGSRRHWTWTSWRRLGTRLHTARTKHVETGYSNNTKLCSLLIWSLA